MSETYECEWAEDALGMAEVARELGLWVAPPRDLTRAEFEKVYRALCFANRKGFVLSSLVTVNWCDLPFRNDEERQRAARHFLDLLRHKLACENVPAAYVHVLELARRGVHSHVMVHVPVWAHDPVRRWLPGGVKKAAGGGSLPDKVAHVRCRRSDRDGVGPQWRWFRYLMKSLNCEIPCPRRWSRLGVATLRDAAGIRRRGYGVAADLPGAVAVAELLGPTHQAEWGEPGGEGFSSRGFVCGLDGPISSPRDLYTDVYFERFLACSRGRDYLGRLPSARGGGRAPGGWASGLEGLVL